LFVGPVASFGGYYITTEHLNNSYSHLSQWGNYFTILLFFFVGIWFFCVPFGFRTIEYVISKLIRGNWIIPGILYVGLWVIKLAISIQFAPLFFLIQLVSIVNRSIKRI